MAAKVDSAALQDGYQLYHHAFFFTGRLQWCVVQQGISSERRTARRYHWLSDSVASFMNEPHQAICSDLRGETLNLVAAEHAPLRAASVELAAGPPAHVLDVARRDVEASRTSPGLPFDGAPTLDLPRRHPLLLRDVDPRRLETVLLSTYERPPADFEALLGRRGVGARTLRAHAPRARTRRSGNLRDAREHARSGALRVRPRRQRRNTVSG
jgi:hypothetical protein